MIDMKRNNLEKIIHEKDLTQESAARQAKIPQLYFHRILYGDVSPSVDTVLKITRGLNVTFEEIWGDCLA